MQSRFDEWRYCYNHVRPHSSLGAPTPIDFVSIDVSFIPLALILPAVAAFLRGELIALIKPQFEVGKGQVGKGGDDFLGHLLEVGHFVEANRY